MMTSTRSAVLGLARVPLPTPDEHASGYIRRLAEQNGLLLRDFRGLLGIRAISPRSEPEAWLRLASRLGVPIGTFDAMRWRPVSAHAGRWLSILGHEVHDSFLYVKSPQFCGQCLSANSIFQSSWAFRHITACSFHKIQLTNSCPSCKHPIGLTKSFETWTCGKCGNDFRLGPAAPASADEITISEWLTARLLNRRAASRSGIALNPSRSSVQEMITTLEYLGSLSLLARNDGPTQRRRPCQAPLFVDFHKTADEFRETNRQALALLIDWPRAYHRLLETLIDRHPASLTATPLLQRFGSRAGLYALQVLTDRHGEPLPFLSDARLSFLKERVGYRPRGRVPKRKQSELIPVAPANAADLLPEEATRRKLFGSKVRTLAHLVAAGRLTPLRTQRGGLGFAMSEVEAVNSFVAALPEPPVTRKDLIPISLCLDRSCRHQDTRANLLNLILTGQIEAYSVGDRLNDVQIPRPALQDFQALSALRAWTARDHYARLHPLNGHLMQLWGPMGRYSTAEANQLVAAGKLRFQRAPYKQRGEPTRYHVGDIVRDVQSWLGPFLIDVDAIEPRLPVPG